LRRPPTHEDKPRNRERFDAYHGALADDEERGTITLSVEHYGDLRSKQHDLEGRGSAAEPSGISFEGGSNQGRRRVEIGAPPRFIDR
jgi:hypothetical protein